MSSAFVSITVLAALLGPSTGRAVYILARVVMLYELDF
jgi:hypothetical protein